MILRHCTAVRSARSATLLVGFDAVLVHEGEEVRMVHEQRAREIRHVGVGRIDVAFRQREELFFDRQRLRDQLRARERRAARVRIPAKAMPQAKELLAAG